MNLAPFPLWSFIINTIDDFKPWIVCSTCYFLYFHEKMWEKAKKKDNEQS